MKKLDRFILTSFIGPFFMILLVVIFILVMQFLWVYIDELVGKGLDFKIIVEFLFWGSCTVLPLALPLATLLASMMTVGSMGENNELIALKAAGVSVLRVMAPLMIASMIISIGTYFVINKLVPVAYNEIFTPFFNKLSQGKVIYAMDQPWNEESQELVCGLVLDNCLAIVISHDQTKGHVHFSETANQDLSDIGAEHVNK